MKLITIMKFQCMLIRYYELVSNSSFSTINSLELKGKNENLNQNNLMRTDLYLKRMCHD